MENSLQKNLLEKYKKHKKEIKNKLKEFSSLPKKNYFEEFQFCLLTPQSNAIKSWEAVKLIKKTKRRNIKSIAKILSSKTRFHNTKAKRIINSKASFEKIKPLLKEKDIIILRNTLAEKVNGYGLKEASHFLRNIGLSNNKIAILDRHILKNLKKHKIIKEDKIKNKKHYLEIERDFKKFSNRIKIPIDELDLLFWSNENGKIFK